MGLFEYPWIDSDKTWNEQIEFGDISTVKALLVWRACSYLRTWAKNVFQDFARNWVFVVPRLPRLDALGRRGKDMWKILVVVFSAFSKVQLPFTRYLASTNCNQLSTIAIGWVEPLRDDDYAKDGGPGTV